MKWILLGIAAFQYGGSGPTAFTAEFDTEAACLNARKVMGEHIKQTAIYQSRVQAAWQMSCVPKGDNPVTAPGNQ